MKQLFLIAFILYLIFPPDSTVFAQADAEKKVLIIHNFSDEAHRSQLRILDSIVGQFTSQITIMEEKDSKIPPKEEYTHLFYFGGENKKSTASTITYIESFSGKVFVIGSSPEQLGSKFSFIKEEEDILLTDLQIADGNIEEKLPGKILTTSIEITDSKVRTLATGTTDSGSQIPFIVSEANAYYLAGDSLFDPLGSILTETLFDFFDIPKLKKHHILLRLEDIHPGADPVTLKEIAVYLKEEKIPYLMVVIPEYRNTETNETLHLSDSPKLVKTLQYMQENGGSVVLHGFKHQYRMNETGEGFEYWDVENDRPILQKADEPVIRKENFSTQEAYDVFLQEGLTFENTYITASIKGGVEELVAHKLYPLAFEAPHYAMSQSGYKILANHFSTYIGQVQLTDQTWKEMYAPLTESTPAFLYGMTLLPETVGFIEESNPSALTEMKQKISQRTQYSNAYLSFFYHPYLGTERFKKTISLFQNQNQTEWIDLKVRENNVQIDDITITSEQGSIEVEKDFISSSYEKEMYKGVVLHRGLAGFIMIVLGVFLILLRKQKKEPAVFDGN